MASYLSPGVYVEEVDSGSRPIEGVGTATVGFVGIAPNADASVNEAVPLVNWGQFMRAFVRDGDASTPLANGVHGFFLNGGTRCYVVNIGNGGAISGNGAGLDALAAIDEIAMVAAPGFTDVASHSALTAHAEGLGTCIAILDSPASVDDVEVLTRVAEAETTSAKSAAAGDSASPEKSSSKAAARKGQRAPESKRGYAAQYFPHIRVRDALDPSQIVDVAPSGHIAGIYARTDGERGVHKAPANVGIRGALGVSQSLTRAEQDVLNPAGVNAIRFFSGQGVTVWGARTLALSASNWRYVNVRRLFIMAEESIRRGTQWVVFEPNDERLWKSITRDVSAFLMLLWRQGALQGSTPEQAFFVKCDAETNTQEEIDAGRVVTLIGMAPVKPAEFVVFRIGQSAGGASVETA
jgi:phage tail sheath protein FI